LGDGDWKALRPLGLTHTQLLALAAVSHAFDDEIDGATQASNRVSTEVD
jgi:hypothetical protein